SRRSSTGRRSGSQSYRVAPGEFVFGQGFAVRAVLRAIFASARRASLTDSGSGNAAATSGASTTTFVPAAYRRAYLPRSPRLKSYSASMSGPAFFVLDALFIILPLAPGRRAGADDPD